jgi:hypothetical protein
MNKTYLRIATALIGFAGLAISAKAQAVDQVIVDIPFDFSVAGKTLPAGNYRVSRVNDWNDRALLIRSLENHAGVIIFSDYTQSASRENTKLTFKQVGDEHFLGTIATADHVFGISVSPQDVQAAERQQNAPTVSSTRSK